MPAAARHDLESLLRQRKLDHTLSNWSPAPEGSSDSIALRWLVPTGMAALDARLGGGFPRGHLSEIVGPRSSGRLAMAVSALATATARGEAVALIDPLDMFDPVSAAANCLDFQRMLWVRGEACGAARVSLSSEYGTLQKNLDRAVKAMNIVLQAGPHARQPRVGPEAGGFGLVVLDLGEMGSQAIKRLPYTTWLRLHRVIEGSETACVLLGSEPIARSSGGATVVLAPEARSLKPEGGISARVIRSRALNTDDHVRLPLSAAAC